jgi:hypothetical protein
MRRSLSKVTIHVAEVPFYVAEFQLNHVDANEFYEAWHSNVATTNFYKPVEFKGVGRISFELSSQSHCEEQMF